MQLPVNRFKQALRERRVQYGLWLGIPDATAAEICAQASFDWLLIDGEHAPIGLARTQEMLRTLAPYPLSPIVRPPCSDRHVLKQYLDIGAQTLLVPMVDSAAQAQDIVASLHYPPKGRRGVGTALARAARWNNVADYIGRCDEAICLLVQIETREALAALPEILAIEEVDGVFIGPSDLSAALGHPGDAGHPAVVQAIDSAVETIVQAGKPAGLLCLDPALGQHYRDKGVTFLGVGVDTLLLARSAGQLAASFRDATTAPNDPPSAGY